MNPRFKEFLKPLALKILNLGLDLRKIYSFKHYLRYRKEKKEWIAQGGKIDKSYVILSDYDDSAGTAKGHYFHQDLLIAKLIYDHKPKKHVDVGSRIDGFVAHVASFREIEVLDIRKLEKSEHKNIKFIQADVMKPVSEITTDSLSCLHVIEHFGLGRYNDKLDVDGHNKGIENLMQMLEKNGRLYISFPVSKKDEVHFNAHRILGVNTIFDHPGIKSCMQLLRFDFVDDNGKLHLNINLNDISKDTKYGCGIYTFLKIK
jgi:hypothetical protein